MSTFEVTVSDAEGHIYLEEVEAARFEIEAGGVLTFYRQQEACTLSNTRPRPFRAYREWDEVVALE